MRGEVWVIISDMHDYKVSNFGRIKRFRYGKWRHLKLEATIKGYTRVMIPESQATRPKVRKQYVHRIVAAHFITKPKGAARLEIDHVNGDKSDNAATNLQWVTGSENMNRHYSKPKPKAL